MKSAPRSRRGRSGAPRAKADRYRLRRILVPLDLSGHSREALHYALPLAEKFSAGIVLLHTVPPRLTDPGLALIAVEKSSVKRHAKQQLDEVAGSIAPAAVDVRAMVAVGHAAEAIVTTADRVGADLIVLTSHGRSGVKRFLMGSTAELVVRHARVPVLVVRRR